MVRLTFVSKAQALAQMKKKFPHLFVEGLPKNPLPDTYIAVPDQLSDAAGIAASMHHLPGVANVMRGSVLPNLCSA